MFGRGVKWCGDARGTPCGRLRLAGDHRILAADNVDPGVRRGGRGGHNRGRRGIDGLVGRTQSPAFARVRIVGADAEAGDRILEPDVEAEALARALAALRRLQSVAERVSDEPALMPFDRRSEEPV